MRKRFLLFCFAMASLGVVANVEVVLDMEGRSFEIGEPVRVALTVNVSDGKDFLWFSNCAGNVFGPRHFLVSKKGRTLKCLSESARRAVQEETWQSVSNGTVVACADLTKIYSEPYYVDVPHSLLESGVYEVQFDGSVSVREDMSQSKGQQVRLKSNTVSFEIRQVDDETFLSALRVLSSGVSELNPLELERAVLKIRGYNGSLAAKCCDVMRSVIESAPRKFKRQAILVLGLKRLPECRDCLLQLLPIEQDASLRAEIVAALSYYDDRIVVEALIDECKSRREKSYRTAIVVLGKMGNRSALPVLREIESSDSEEAWIRKRAAESIRRISEKPLTLVTNTPPAVDQPQTKP